MEKLWIECQKCGSVFWVYSEEISTIYPKRSVDYQICSKCEQTISKNWFMLEYFSTLKEELGFYYSILKVIFYFLIGSITIIIIQKFYSFINFFFSRFSKEKFIDNIQFIFKIIIFIFFSIIMGWIVINLIF